MIGIWHSSAEGVLDAQNQPFGGYPGVLPSRLHGKRPPFHDRMKRAYFSLKTRTGEILIVLELQAFHGNSVKIRVRTTSTSEILFSDWYTNLQLLILLKRIIQELSHGIWKGGKEGRVGDHSWQSPLFRILSRISTRISSNSFFPAPLPL